jgi:hypothetical protein
MLFMTIFSHLLSIKSVFRLIRGHIPTRVHFYTSKVKL